MLSATARCGAASSTSACPDTTTRGERRHNHIESPRDRSLAGVRTFRATPESDSGGTKCKEKNAGAGDVPGARVSPCLLYLVELSRSTLAFEVFARNPGCCLAGGSEACRQCHAADESFPVGSRSTRAAPPDREGMAAPSSRLGHIEGQASTRRPEQPRMRLTSPPGFRSDDEAIGSSDAEYSSSEKKIDAEPRGHRVSTDEAFGADGEVNRITRVEVQRGKSRRHDKRSGVRRRRAPCRPVGR